jgi:diaminopimelate decarboxylase
MSRALHNYLKDSVPGTPFFIYDMGLLKDTLSELHKASKPGDYKIHYALKANSNREILELIAASGLGADCVSGPEIERAMETGFTASKIAFAGVGKTDEEILTGLGAGIFSFNCESAEEIKVISELAGREGKVAPIALRINPNVNANTHKYITTGLEENKFGINPWEFDAVCEVIKNSGNVSLKGLHFHIGSQINDLEPFRNLCLRANEMWTSTWVAVLVLTTRIPTQTPFPDLPPSSILSVSFFIPFPEGKCTLNSAVLSWVSAVRW